MHDHREFKDAVYEQVARVGRAVAHAKRLEILDLLCQGAVSVERLAQKCGLSMGSTSQHLQVLRQARLVRRERHGTYAVYSLSGEISCTLFQTLRQVAEDYYAEMREVTESFLAGQPDLEAVDLTTLEQRVASDQVIMLDVRPVEEYAAGHWPGALSLPLETLADRLAELPRDRTIAAYCRGPYCVLSLEAVALLRQHGYQAVRLSEGVPEWRARGLEVAAGQG